ncbi:MAG: glycosyltransferase family 4 protein [Acidobacteria bacterium]|nr:glycosyltransferase family 4 protein [Acidobacteriota bacterium]
MKILITHPFCWPWVRRGAERYLAELSGHLARRGHEVTVLSTEPGPGSTSVSDGVTYIKRPQPRSRLLTAVGIPPETQFIGTCFRHLLRSRGRYDVVGAMLYSDSIGAMLSWPFHRIPCVVHITGFPYRRWLRRRPLDTLTMIVAVRFARRVAVHTRQSLQLLSELFGVDGYLLPPPTDTSRFTLRTERDLGSPILLAAGAFSERRKGGRILVKAFELVKRCRPTAILQFSGSVGAPMQRELLGLVPPALHRDILFTGTGKPEDLPSVYGRAAVTILPAVREAFGMVLAESLACGTPVVGGRDGGIPEIVEDGVGYLFDPGGTRREPANFEGLAEAILKALDLHADPDLPRRCRESGMRFSWDRYSPEYEAFYALANE